MKIYQNLVFTFDSVKAASERSRDLSSGPLESSGVTNLLTHQMFLTDTLLQYLFLNRPVVFSYLWLRIALVLCCVPVPWDMDNKLWIELNKQFLFYELIYWLGVELKISARTRRAWSVLGLIFYIGLDQTRTRTSLKMKKLPIYLPTYLYIYQFLFVCFFSSSFAWVWNCWSWINPNQKTQCYI